MNSTVFFKTQGNYYMYDVRLQNYTLTHSLIFHLHNLDKKGVFPSGFSDLCESNLFQKYSTSELEYYFYKYLHLKELGYFSEIEKVVRRLFSSKNVKNAFYNTESIVFEVTDACNLRCKYCGYGEFYDDYDIRSNQYMEFDTVKCLIEYLSQYWLSLANQSTNKTVSIGFYGGEPLLNFKLIKRTVEFLKSQSIANIRFKYNMTTNATLLHKHIDFLVENDFRLLISLDGSESNHSYRVYHNGKNSHANVLANIELIRKKYPKYYKENVNYNSVLHNRNSVEDINDYIRMKLDKIPKISSLNDSGIREEKKDEFSKLYNNYSLSLDSSEKKGSIVNERFVDDPNVYGLGLFLHWFNDNQYNNYTSIFTKQNSYKFISTGTCIPFERKIFVTVNHKILACERINQKYVLGYIENNSVVINFEKIAKMYCDFFDHIYRLCKNCYRSGKCSQCILQFENLDADTSCHGFQNETQFANTVGQHISMLEQHPEFFKRLIKEVFFK